jgi:DNA repair protein RadC
VVVVHNHPSGDPTPSGADLQLTRRLAKAGEVLGIELLDHIVIGDGGAHVSMRTMGVL